MPRVLIYQPQFSGHALYWAELISRAAILAGGTPIVTIESGGLESAECQRFLNASREGGEIIVHGQPVGRSRLGRIASESRLIAQLATESRAEKLVLSTAYGTMDALNLGRLVGLDRAPELEHTGALVMASAAAYGQRDPRIPGTISKISLKAGRWKSLLAIDPAVTRWLARHAPRGSRVRLVPDPIETFPPLDKVTARRQLGLPIKGRIVASLGMQDRRKGIDELFQAFVEAELPPDDRIVLAGPGAGAWREKAAVEFADRDLADRIVSVDRFLSHQELHSYAAAADVVAVFYRWTSLPSGIAIRALAASRPIVAPAEGWYVDMVPAFGLGWCFERGRGKAGAGALRAALEGSDGFTRSEAALRLLDFQSPENFVRCWVGVLTEEPVAAAGSQNWSWVLEAVKERYRARLQVDPA